MFVRPNPLHIDADPAYVVPDPVLKDKLPPEGREVPESSYWHRRIFFGDVILVEDQKPVKTAKKGDTQ